MGPTNKLLLKYKSHTIIEEVLEQMLHSEVDDILIVTGFEKVRIEKAVVDQLTDRVTLVHNSDYRLGRAESIKCAVRSVAQRADAMLFMVGDKPGVTRALIDRAIDRYRKDRPAIFYVETPSGRGHPIIFSKALYAELLSLQGDCIGDELVAKHKADLVTLKDKTIQVDINNEADYNILLAAHVAGNTG
jgi:molybdenum cofactor cytidylyltransferase